MAYGIKSAKVSCSSDAVQFAESGTGKILQISTVGNSGTVYIGASGVTADTGMALIKDQVYDWQEDEDMDFSKLYVYSSGSDGLTYIYLDRF